MQFLAGVKDRGNFQRNSKNAGIKQMSAVICFECQAMPKVDVAVREGGSRDPLIADESAS
jgi:hypothetical protein